MLQANKQCSGPFSFEFKTATKATFNYNVSLSIVMKHSGVHDTMAGVQGHIKSYHTSFSIIMTHSGVHDTMAGVQGHIKSYHTSFSIDPVCTDQCNVLRHAMHQHLPRI